MLMVQLVPVLLLTHFGHDDGNVQLAYQSRVRVDSSVQDFLVTDRLITMDKGASVMIADTEVSGNTVVCPQNSPTCSEQAMIEVRGTHGRTPDASLGLVNAVLEDNDAKHSIMTYNLQGGAAMVYSSPPSEVFNVDTQSQGFVPSLSITDAPEDMFGTVSDSWFQAIKEVRLNTGSRRLHKTTPCLSKLQAPFLITALSKPVSILNSRPCAAWSEIHPHTSQLKPVHTTSANSTCEQGSPSGY